MYMCLWLQSPQLDCDLPAACALSTDRGPCTNYTVYWYYDLQYGGCSRFWYGGCEGNGNRFTSKEECEDVCVYPSPKGNEPSHLTSLKKQSEVVRNMVPSFSDLGD